MTSRSATPNRQFSSLPRSAAWRIFSDGGREGFEVARFKRKGAGMLVQGSSVGIESGKAWAINYAIEMDSNWCARMATIELEDSKRLKVRSNGAGRWTINGERQPLLDGCLDLDLEASLVTNMAPVHRLSLRVGQRSQAPAVYVRTRSLKVERLEQTYLRIPDANGRVVFDYDAPRFSYRAALQFARDGLVVVYPQIGERR
jgi:hypothetical protein